MKLKLITKNGNWLTNKCGLDLENGMPMVGCKYCKNVCLHNKGTVKFLFWKFVKCNKRGDV